MFCMSFGKQKDKEMYYTGTMNGQIYVWKGNQLEEMIPGAHEGVIYCMIPYENGFITAGKDGRIRTWDPNFTAIEIIDLKALLNDSLAEHNTTGKIEQFKYFKLKLFKIYFFIPLKNRRYCEKFIHQRQ
jgi:hypothetical protein